MLLERLYYFISMIGSIAIYILKEIWKIGMINNEWTREDLQKVANFASMSKEKAKEIFSDLPQFLNGYLFATDSLLRELIDIFDEYEISYTPEEENEFKNF